MGCSESGPASLSLGARCRPRLHPQLPFLGCPPPSIYLSLSSNFLSSTLPALLRPIYPPQRPGEGSPG